jgi:hypothetical protein
VAHDCPRDGTPAFGCSSCYGHLKPKALNGGRDKLTESELEFVGATVHVHDTSGAWRQPIVSVIVDAGGMDQADRDMLQALMDVEAPDRERLRFPA